VKKGIAGKDSAFVLVAEMETKPVGFIYCITQEKPIVYKIKKLGYIKDLFVLPALRRKGIAKALIEETIKEFRKRKLKYIALDVLTGNHQAIKAYKKLGFKEFGKDMRKEAEAWQLASIMTLLNGKESIVRPTILLILLA